MSGRRRATALFSSAILLAGLQGACSDSEPRERPPEASGSSEPSQSTPETTPTLSKRERRIARKEAAEAERKARAAEERAREEERKLRAQAEDHLVATMEALLSYYNEEDFAHASAYVHDRFVQQCGGATNLAYAFAQNKNSERLNYIFHKLKVTEIEGRSARADVTYSARDEQSGELYDDHFIVGLAFVRNAVRDTGWVLDELFPIGVGAFC